MAIFKSLFKKEKNNNNAKKSILNSITGEPLFQDIVEFVVTNPTVSVSTLQRKFKIGYSRAVECINILERYGIIGNTNGESPREILMRDIDEITENIKGKNEKKDFKEEMSGFDFELYSADLLKANGFDRVSVTQFSGDYGVDIIAYKDDIKYAIQCKKYSSPVGIKAVQEVIGSKSMNDCHVAVVLTNNIFTKNAQELAEKNNVLLWDKHKLNEMIEKTKNTVN